MDFRKLITRFRQFGGMRLVWQYARLGVVPTVLRGLWRFTVKGSWWKVGVFQCCKGLYGEVIRKVEPYLIERYGSMVQDSRLKVHGEANDNLLETFGTSEQARANENGALTPSINLGTEGSATGKRTIWWCWLQGLDAALPIVKACYNSLVHGEWFKVHGYTVKVIDAKNWREYVELPGYIVEKWEKGRIPAAMFSDLLRVELLIKYGGTWIDSTVLCTGGSRLMDQGSRLLDAPLFVFQYTKEGSVPVSISNWFISACRNNEVLMVLREMLYAYWRDYDCVLDYYIFHLFSAMISKEYPEQMAAMPYAQSQRSLVLLHHWGEKYDQKKWDNLTSQVCFHKLAFRVNDHIKKDQENYYNHILSEYGRI